MLTTLKGLVSDAVGVRQVARVIGCSNAEVGDLVNLYSKLTSERALCWEIRGCRSSESN